ncbi:hypothetical protein evm_012484 [Chilo suppressalis]|nr:hypothetical protein evm_012484 [Chilo suppressalis]
MLIHIYTGFNCFFLIKLTFALNYCGSNVCNNTKQHTLCKYQSQEPASHCIDYEKTIRTNQDRTALLNKINERRNRIASGDVHSYASADNMLKLEWNEELEKFAQRWADQCVKQTYNWDQEDTCRDLGYLSVGQNIATVYGESPGLSPLSMVDVWYTELLNANASLISHYKPFSFRLSDSAFSRYHYFTQLVWARSSEVGCGGVKFKELLEGDRSNKNRTVNRLVCNFAARGNIAGEAVYSTGPPCSRCPIGSTCDTEYKALCGLTHHKTKPEESVLMGNKPTTNTHSENTTDTENINDNITFDYISQYFDFTRQLLTTPSTRSSSSCKDLAVDEFIELLKKKLSSDPLLKELLLSTKNMQNGNNDFTFTDPNVAVFVSKIYSKKMPTTTTKLPEQEYVNSTLLVDLVEAVIFRSGERNTPTQQLEELKQPAMDVSPVKIQAELAEIKLNHDFTGHYFFPEDITEESNTETVDLYDNTPNIPASDIVLEIENLKRTERTKNFLDDIIESDVTESQLERRKRGVGDVPKNKYRWEYSVKSGQPPHSLNTDHQKIVIKYGDLSKKLAADLKILKLNEIFHCSYNNT